MNPNGAGGAIYYYGGPGTPESGSATVRIVESEFVGNRAADGGAIVLGAQAHVGGVEIDLSEFRSNIASYDDTSTGRGGAIFFGGAIDDEGTYVVSRSAITGNVVTNVVNEDGVGGGIYFALDFVTDSTGTYLFRDTTIAGNEATSAGGAYLAVAEDIEIEFLNSTISGNMATEAGGGLFVDAIDSDSVRLNHSTVTGNLGGDGAGLYLSTSGSTILNHTVVSGNMDDTDPSNISGTLSVTASTYNFVGTGGSGGITGPTNQINDDPMLAPLGDYDGFVLPSGQTIQTHHPQIGSPVIDAGDPSLQPGSGAPLYDQRGDGFTRVYTSTPPVPQVIDIGAVEVQEVEEPCPPGDYNRDGVVNAADYVVWRNTLGDVVMSPYEEADGDGSLEIAQPDYGVWYENFGNECEMESAGASMVGIKSNPQTPDNLRVHAVGAMPPMQMMVLDRNASELAQNQPKLFGHELQDGRQQAHGTALLLLYDFPTEAREDGDLNSLELGNLTCKAGEMDSAERLLINESAIDEIFGNAPFAE